MAREAVWEIRKLITYAPLAIGIVLGVLCLVEADDRLFLFTIILLMLGIVPIIIFFEDNPLPLVLGGLFTLASGIFLCYFIYTVSAPLEQEELTEIQGTFASIRIIRRRGLDDYCIQLQGDNTPYRGLTFLDFPGVAISETAQEGDTVEILYSEGQRSRSIYAFRLNGRDFLSYETTCRARDENRKAAWFLLIIPAAVCIFRLWGAFQISRKQSYRKQYRYTGRRR
ncbi:MAG: hypothetical protein HFF84_03455 [Oscillibacter sp.]|nr:hypothetical protein [Oscillibacter sp.]